MDEEELKVVALLFLIVHSSYLSHSFEICGLPWFSLFQGFHVKYCVSVLSIFCSSCSRHSSLLLVNWLWLVPYSNKHKHIHIFKYILCEDTFKHTFIYIDTYNTDSHKSTYIYFTQSKKELNILHP